MLPANSGNDGWATESLSTTLLYPRGAVKEPLIARSYLTTMDVLVIAEVNTQLQIVEIRSESGELLDTVPSLDVLSMDLAFDQLDRRFLTWQSAALESTIFIYWYDPTIPGYTTTQIANGLNPCCMIDERRASLLPNSDIFLFYQRGDELFYRLQRDRYLIEHSIPHSNTDFKLITCGMGTHLRMSLRIESDDGILATVGGYPVLINDTDYVGFPEGTIPWPESSSNTRT